MKKSLIFLFLFFTVFAAHSADTLLCANLDWTLGVRLGAEWRFSRWSGIKADFGVAMLRVPAADLFYVLHLLPEDRRLRLNLLLGIPNLIIPMEFDPLRLYMMLSPGASLALGFWISERTAVDLRFGGGLPLFFGEADELVIRPLRIPASGSDEGVPLYFWPDLALSVNFRLGNKRP